MNTPAYLVSVIYNLMCNFCQLFTLECLMRHTATIIFDIFSERSIPRLRFRFHELRNTIHSISLFTEDCT